MSEKKVYYLQNTHLEVCTWTTGSAYDPEVNPQILNELEVIDIESYKRLEKAIQTVLSSSDQEMNLEGAKNILREALK